MSKIVRLASCGIVSHAMICVQHSSVIDSTFLGVHARNLQREIFGPSEQVFVLRLREPLSPIQLATIVGFVRSKVGTRYSVLEAARSVVGVMSPRTRRLFCSRLVARAYAGVGVSLVEDPDYCTPEMLRRSSKLSALFDFIEDVSDDELTALKREKKLVDNMQQAQNKVLKSVRRLRCTVENFNDVEKLLIDHPEFDDRIASAYRDSGYLDIWKAEFDGYRWRYDLDLMLAITNASKLEGLQSYCVNTIREFHSGGLRFAENFIYYQYKDNENGLRTHRQFVELYTSLVNNYQLRCNVALGWLERHFPNDINLNLERITPHSDHWFAIIEQVQPTLGIAARNAIEHEGSLEVCSSCGDPAEDYWLINSAEIMPGVPSLRLCDDCAVIRRAGGEILRPFVV